MNNSNVKISIATTEAQKNACFGLRYQVYVGEMGYQENAENEMLCDGLDASGTIFQATIDGKTVATLRMNFAKDCPESYAKLYGFSKFSTQELAATVVVTKLMVAKEYRHTAVIVQLLNFYYDMCVINRIENHLLACSDQLLALYTKMGFVPHSEVYTHPVYGKSTPMIARTFDYSHLASVRSPLRGDF